MSYCSGDTTTGFTAAVPAFYQKIPVSQIEAWFRTHNLHFPFPEEINKITFDDINRLYFAPKDWPANNLLKDNKIQVIFL